MADTVVEVVTDPTVIVIETENNSVVVSPTNPDQIEITMVVGDPGPKGDKGDPGPAGPPGPSLEAYGDASGLANGPLPATLDSGQAVSNFGGQPFKVVGGQYVHDDPTTSNSAAYMQVDIGKRVGRIGMEFVIPDSGEGTVALVVPSTSWAGGLTPAGIHFSMNPTAYGIGYWTGSGQDIYYSSSFVTPLAPGTHRVDIVLDGATAYILLPNGQTIEVADPRIESAVSTLAIWELYEATTSETPLRINSVWADGVPSDVSHYTSVLDIARLLPSNLPDVSTLGVGDTLVKRQSDGTIVSDGFAMEREAALPWEAISKGAAEALGTSGNVNNTVVRRDGGGNAGFAAVQLVGQFGASDATRKDYVDALGSSGTAPDTVARRDSAGWLAAAGVYIEDAPVAPYAATRKDYVDSGLAAKANTTHTHTATDVSDSTATGRSVLTAADAATARTAIGAGTSSLVTGTTAGTAAAGNDSRLSDARTPTAHTHPASQISDSTATGRSVLTAVDAAAGRAAIGAGTSNLAIGTTSTTAKAGDYAPAVSSETVSGTVELATAAETTTGTDNTRAVHPAGLKVELDKKPARALTKNSISANYTLVAGDAIDVVIHSTAAAGITVTVPQDSAATISQEIAIPWRQYGAGQITFAAGAGATLISRGSVFKSAGQYAEGLLTKVAANTWLLSGDITS